MLWSLSIGVSQSVNESHFRSLYGKIKLFTLSTPLLQRLSMCNSNNVQLLMRFSRMSDLVQLNHDLTMFLIGCLFRCACHQLIVLTDYTHYLVSFARPSHSLMFLCLLPTNAFLSHSWSTNSIKLY